MNFSVFVMLSRLVVHIIEERLNFVVFRVYAGLCAWKNEDNKMYLLLLFVMVSVV